MLYACSRCGKVHARGQCPREPEKFSYKKKERTDIVRFRSSAAWQRKQKEILERDRYLCKLCLYKGVITNQGLSVHHIIPIRENDKLKLEDHNLITLCSVDHAMVEGDKGYRPLLLQLAISPPEKILK